MDDPANVTEETVAEQIAQAQRAIDVRGTDPETGVYLIITGNREPGVGTATDRENARTHGRQPES